MRLTAASGTIEIFDIEGRRVRRMLGDPRGEIAWDGRDDTGALVRPGVYLHRLTTVTGTWNGKSLLIR